MTARLLIAGAIALGAIALGHAPASAGFKVCNGYRESASFAIAYNDVNAGHWIASGWWTIAPSKCKTPLGGKLKDRYYYVYAYSATKQWKGTSPVCVDPDKSFEFAFAKGEKSCRYSWRNFYLVDTGKASSSTATLR